MNANAKRIQSILSCELETSGRALGSVFWVAMNHPGEAVPASNCRRGKMQPKSWFRVGVMAALVTALAIVPAIPNAPAQQGPQPPVQQQPEPTKPPSTAPGEPGPQKQPEPPQVSISVQSNLVNVDAVVTDQDGNLVTGLKRENFRILDEGQPQQVTIFSPSDAPITVVILLEYSGTYYGYFGAKGAYWADGFLNDLKPQDWVALKTFDLQVHLREDFTQDKRAIDESL